MRIIAGTRKGLTLRAPEGLRVRPTPMRVREAAMSILGATFDGEEVLDLCAGAGTIGLELLSRGAGRAVFVEPDAEALAVLRANVRKARFDDRAQILGLDAKTALGQLAKAGARFDIVWLDPPWDAKLYHSLLEALATSGTLRTSSDVWVESPAGLDDATMAGRWRRIDQRRYGSVVLDRLELLGPGETP